MTHALAPCILKECETVPGTVGTVDCGRTHPTLAVPVAVISADRSITEFNDEFERLSAIPADTLVGAPIAAALRVDDAALAEALAGDTRSGLPLSTTDGGTLVVRAARVSRARTVIAVDPAWRAPNVQGRDLAQRESERLQLLLAAAVAFAATRTESELGALVAETAQKAFNSSACSVHTGQTGNYRLVGGENLLESVWPEDAPSRGTLTVDVGRVVKIESPEAADAAFPQFSFGDVLKKAGVVSVIAAPITTDDDQLGAFVCYFDQPRTFDEQADPLAEALAQLAAQVVVRLRLESQIRRAAMLDEITGLPNRRLFEESFAQSHILSAEHTAILFLDLDGFKAVNDSLGHAQGDAILQQVADRMRAVFRQDDSVARYGGDEFVAAFQVPNPDEAREIADRARKAIAQPYPALPEGLQVTASIGISVTKVDSDSAPMDRLLRLADQAMYASKSRGGNQVTMQLL